MSQTLSFTWRNRILIAFTQSTDKPDHKFLFNFHDLLSDSRFLFRFQFTFNFNKTQTKTDEILILIIFDINIINH